VLPSPIDEILDGRAGTLREAARLIHSLAIEVQALKAQVSDLHNVLRSAGAFLTASLPEPQERAAQREVSA